MMLVSEAAWAAAVSSPEVPGASHANINEFPISGILGN